MIFRKLIQRIRLRIAKRRLSRAQLLAAEWERDASNIIAYLKSSESRIEGFLETARDLMDMLSNKREEIRKLESKHRIALESLRGENKVMADITIPALTAACEMSLERWRAETAVQVRRQVAVEDRSK